jgi:hypothetical protein
MPTKIIASFENKFTIPNQDHNTQKQNAKSIFLDVILQESQVQIYHAFQIIIVIPACEIFH